MKSSPPTYLHKTGILTTQRQGVSITVSTHNLIPNPGTVVDLRKDTDATAFDHIQAVDQYKEPRP